LLLGTDSNAKVGAHLIGFNGMTLYRYTKDSANVSNCTGQCAVNWPPYVVPSTDALGNIQAGVKGKVGSTNRADGSIQVTYNGSPLYFYIGDKNSGDTTGQNVGGVWFVLKP
jgi:predicted lipoprotein with Yx(FWY)xxD motif